MYVKEQFRKVKAIYPEAVASTTAGTPTSLNISGYNLTVYCTTGALYINPTTTATTLNSVWVKESNNLNLNVNGTLSILGDTTTAKYQVITWDN